MDTDFDIALAKFQMEFGQHIRRLRKQRQWSQDDVANNSGLTKAHISKIERGLSKPGIDSFLKLALCFHISLYELFIFSNTNCDIKNLKASIKQLVDDMDDNVTPDMIICSLTTFFLHRYGENIQE